MVEGEVVGGHAVHRCDGTECAGVVVGPLVTHDANGADGKQNGEGLPDRIVETGVADFFQIDLIGLPQDGQLFRCDVARDANRKPRSWEGMAADEAFRKPNSRPSRGPRP